MHATLLRSLIQFLRMPLAVVVTSALGWFFPAGEADAQWSRDKPIIGGLPYTWSGPLFGPELPEFSGLASLSHSETLYPSLWGSKGQSVLYGPCGPRDSDHPCCTNPLLPGCDVMQLPPGEEYIQRVVYPLSFPMQGAGVLLSQPAEVNRHFSSHDAQQWAALARQAGLGPKGNKHDDAGCEPSCTESCTTYPCPSPQNPLETCEVCTWSCTSCSAGHLDMGILTPTLNVFKYAR